MTAILEEVRRLEAARETGEISAAEFAAAKDRLLETVEEAIVLPLTEANSQRRKATNGTPNPWMLAFIGLCCAGLLTFLTAKLTGDFTLAFTLVTCVFAAIVVAAFRRLEG